MEAPHGGSDRSRLGRRKVHARSLWDRRGRGAVAARCRAVARRRLRRALLRAQERRQHPVRAAGREERQPQHSARASACGSSSARPSATPTPRTSAATPCCAPPTPRRRSRPATSAPRRSTSCTTKRPTTTRLSASTVDVPRPIRSRSCAAPTRPRATTTPRSPASTSASSTSSSTIAIFTSDGRMTGDVQPLVRFNVSCLSERDGKRQTRAGVAAAAWAWPTSTRTRRRHIARECGAPGGPAAVRRRSAGRHLPGRARGRRLRHPPARGDRPRPRGRLQPQEDQQLLRPHR